MTWDDMPDVTPAGQILVRAHIHQVTRAAIATHARNARAQNPHTNAETPVIIGFPARVRDRCPTARRSPK